MRVVETEVFQFDELDERAKERARDWFRSVSFQDTDWAEFTLPDSVDVARILGITVYTRTARLMNGTTRQEPVIYWGLHTQGSGACFDGYYSHEKQTRERLAKHIGSESTGDKELHRIARELVSAQRACGFRGQVKIDARDRSMSIECTDDTDRELDKEIFERIEAALQDFASWIYSQLDAEWDYQNSDESIDENIRLNEYEFTKEGKRA